MLPFRLSIALSQIHWSIKLQTYLNIFEDCLDRIKKEIVDWVKLAFGDDSTMAVENFEICISGMSGNALYFQVFEIWQLIIR